MQGCQSLGPRAKLGPRADFIWPALGAAAAALAGVGLGLGPRIGPCCSFAPLPDAAMWLLTLGMLAGRLEILLLALPLTPAFWRR